jgi:hypothetical protein
MALRFEEVALRAVDLEFAIDPILRVSMIVPQAGADDEVKVGFTRGLVASAGTLGVLPRYHLRAVSVLKRQRFFHQC